MKILWAPSETGVGRRFRIVVSTEREIACSVTEHLELLDEAFDGKSQRFYFRAVVPGDAKVSLNSGEATVTVHVIAEAAWSDPATRGSLDLPRIWRYGDDLPLKSRHSVTDPATIGRQSTDTPEKPDTLQWSYGELWGMEPPCDIPRWHFLNLDRGCPVHGLDIYESDPYYPWIVDVRNEPYRVQCPVGGEWYPTNDYAAGDHTGGDFPDDGWGWQRTEADGTVSIFGFISYSLLRRIRAVYTLVNELSAYFEATADPDAARRIAILLVSLAREHRYLCRFPEHRFRRYERTVQEPQYRGTTDIFLGPRETTSPEDLGGGSGMDDYCINMPGQYVICARAYDLVFDRIDADAELLDFLRERLPELSNGESIRRFIETYLFRAAAQAGLDDAISSNLPEPQRGMIAVIRALDIPETVELTDWLVNGGGHVSAMSANYYYKDGAGYESTGGYNGMHVSALVPIEEGLRALRETYPERYPDDRFGANLVDDAGAMRYRDVLTYPLDIVVAQLTHPFIGDTGDIPNTRPLQPMPAMPMSTITEVYRSASRRFPNDVRFRAVLEQLERRDALRRQAQQQQGKATGFYSAERPPDIHLRPDPRLYQDSRLIDGYGVGILESGPRTTSGRRGVWLYYGDHPSHCHEQQLDIGLIAHQRNLVRHMGYPYSWQHMGEWDASWITHHTVNVVGDEAVWWRPRIQAFHPGRTGFQMLEAGGYGLNRERGETQRVLPGYQIRRSLFLIDLPPESDGDERFYALDVLNVTGGREHWWTFHGPPGDLALDGAKLIAQDGGTVAGSDIEYGGDTPEGVPYSLAYLYDVKRGTGPFRATWNVADTDGLKLRITQIGPDDGETVVARGRSPHAPPDKPPYELDWLLRHRCGETSLNSEFISLIESDTELPVKSANVFRSDGVTMIRVELDGLVHRIFHGGEGASEVKIDGVRFSGRTGFVETGSDGAIQRMFLCGNGSLTLDGAGIVRGARDWHATVVALVTGRRTLDIQSDTAPPDSLAGSYLLIRRLATESETLEAAAYHVESVESLGAGMYRCLINWSPRIGAGTVARHTDDGIVHDGQLPLAGSPIAYRDADIVAQNGRRFRIRNVLSSHRDTESTVRIYGADRAEIADAFPIGSEFTIEEIGPGDTAMCGGHTEVNRETDGSWHIAASGPAEVSV